MKFNRCFHTLFLVEFNKNSPKSACYSTGFIKAKIFIHNFIESFLLREFGKLLAVEFCRVFFVCIYLTRSTIFIANKTIQPCVRFGGSNMSSISLVHVSCCSLQWEAKTKSISHNTNNTRQLVALH